MARRLVDGITGAGGGFLADTAPVIFRVEGAASAAARACDPVFELVERGELSCLVSAVSVAELFVGAYRAGAASVATMDAFLRQASVGVVAIDEDTAREAARLLASGKLRRLSDALIAATAALLGLPLVTADRRLARSGAVEALLVTDFA